MRLVILESPFAGPTPADMERKARYLSAAMRDCIQRGDAPYASHALYTRPGVLRDEVPAERELGINAGFAWRPAAAATVVYTDLGYSRGMIAGIGHATLLGHPIEYRELGGEWAT